MSKHRIVYIVVDTQRLTLYDESGETITVNQGDPRVPHILEVAMPLISSGLVAELDLSLPGAYADFEKKSSGLVRFFKVAKQKLTELLVGTDPTEPSVPGEFGIKPVPSQAQQVAEVMAHARPATGQLTPEEATKDTIVAVVGEGAATRVIPEAERVHNHIAHAAKLGGTKAMEAFFARLAKVIDHRGHSVQDLLRFMEKGDLPVAADGSIIAYKRLFRSGERYVDPHTRKVSQGIGSLVCMDEKLVDPSRRHECSQGLHIGRRGYMGGFNGDAIVLVKLAPEDVIAVPHNEPDKIRVRAYHILGELSNQGFGEICGDRPMSSAEDRKLLADALAGTHVGQLDEVRVTGTKGDGVVITPLAAAEPPVPAAEHDLAMAVPVEGVKGIKSAPVDPKSLVKLPETVNQEQEKPVLSPYKKQSHAQRAEQLVLTLMALDSSPTERKAAALQLQALKKASKKSYTVLGVDPKALTVLTDILATEPPEPKVKTSAKTKALTARMSKPVTTLVAVANENQLRDGEIRRLFQLGKSKREIGRLLGISDSTVRRVIG